jgi:chromosome segregation protein
VRLTSLEIKGFKSFADKTIVKFDEGVTGVIGPNGCGKSNIVDSIRWVIGEQKISSLRSDNLEALIFNGSKTRNASSLAEVSLTFENTRNLLPTEFNHVTVTRRFYRNGESEYRLNDVQCRLKDIQNLFLDTGVSTDSYAIIELGMVDEIIKDKDNSRRRMLEQAAGISIYKTRKKEAKNKLDATELDLARIEDLLFEINNQVKTLENQAKKAEKYFEVKKEYQKISVELAKAALQGFNLTYKELQEQNTEEHDKKLALETEITTEEAALESEKLGFVEKEQTLQKLQGLFNELTGQLSQAQSEKSLAQQKLNFLNERKNNTEAFIVKSEAQLQAIEESITFANQQSKTEGEKLNELIGQKETIANEVTEKRAAYDSQRNELDSLRSQLQEIQNSSFEAEKKVAVADTAISNLTQSLTRTQADTSEREKQVNEWQKELETKKAEHEQGTAELKNLHEEQEKLKQAILNTQQELEGLRNNLNEENRQLDSKRNEYALLKNLIDSMEGYPDSVKYLHKNSNWNDQAPILSDLLFVKEEYRAAVENVLEPYLNYFIADNYEQATVAINLLDNNKKGKANFFLLDQLQHVSPSTQNIPQTTSALSVVEFDNKYSALANHLLGNVFISNEGTVPTNVSNAIILEKTGKWVKGQFTLTGGSIGVFEGNKIGRAKNLEKLNDQINARNTAAQNLKATIDGLHNQVIGFNGQLQEQQIKQLEQKLIQLNQQISNLSYRIEQAEQVIGSNKLRVDEFNTQINTTNQSIADTRGIFNNLKQQKDSKQAQMASFLKAFANTEAAFNEAVVNQNNFNLQVASQENKVAALKQELEFKGNQIKEIGSQIESSKAQLEQSKTEAAENNNLLQTITEQVTQLTKQKETDEKELNLADQTYYNLRSALQEKENKLRSKQKQKEQIDSLIGEIKDKVTDMKLHLAGLKERLQVEFRINIDDIIDDARETETPQEDLQQNADKLKRRLENIGEVNPTAIEAHDEIKKRYDFIVEQKTDLVNAKESLMQTIAEVEATSNQKFLETFNEVNDNFKKVFKALFSEDDTAELIMENPENLSETGIDIIAKPKGKRPSNLGQLSGGERTLTATALLFSIYLIKPAPFCILDEVDAPLDDANVGKFTNMIRQFSENSQFIIVTHNKQTMGAVDVIYGVTMQEPGVSKLVPVDFRSLN